MSNKIGITFEELDRKNMVASQGEAVQLVTFTNATGLTLCTTITLTPSYPCTITITV